MESSQSRTLLEVRTHIIEMATELSRRRCLHMMPTVGSGVGTVVGIGVSTSRNDWAAPRNRSLHASTSALGRRLFGEKEAGEELAIFVLIEPGALDVEEPQAGHTACEGEGVDQIGRAHV